MRRVALKSGPATLQIFFYLQIATVQRSTAQIYLVKSGSVRRRAFAWRHRRLPDARLNGPGGARRRRALRASCMANRDTRCESRYTQPIETFAYEYRCYSFSGPHIMHRWRRRALRPSRLPLRRSLVGWLTMPLMLMLLLLQKQRQLLLLLLLMKQDCAGSSSAAVCCYYHHYYYYRS